MNRRFAATLELQRPDHRDPATLLARDVCPHCKRLLTAYRFGSPDGHMLASFHCKMHGDVVPMRSHVVNHTGES